MSIRAIIFQFIRVLGFVFTGLPRTRVARTRASPTLVLLAWKARTRASPTLALLAWAARTRTSSTLAFIVLLGTSLVQCTVKHSHSSRRNGTVTAEVERSMSDAYRRPAAEWPAPTLDEGVVHRELAALPRKAANPAPREQVTLGKRLFFDPLLSASNQISCANCHHPELGWGDGLRQSFGHDRQRGLRNAPTLLNVADWDHFFWDGRAASLQEQALFPIADGVEMSENLETLAQELAGSEKYPGAFARAFGDSLITTARMAEALAAYQSTIRSRISRFDRFVGGDYGALDESEIRGLHLFRTKARCLNCHNGPLLSDQQFHNSGQHLMGRPQEDFGRYYVTGDPTDKGKFRTPTLRDILFTGPYLHHGNILELREVLTMYQSGMPQIIPRRVLDTASYVPVHDPLLRPLELTDREMDDLMAFLGAISVRPRPVALPK